MSKKLNKILTIYDKEYNSKTGKKKFKEYCLGSCILDFKENTRIKYNLLTFNEKNKKFYLNNEIFDMHTYNILIFNYNEDNESCIDYLKKMNNICFHVKKLFPNMKIFNNLFNHKLVVDTYFTYETIEKKNLKNVKIPLFGKIDDKKMYKNFPIIISRKKQSGGTGKYLIHNLQEYEELKKKYNIEKYFWAKFYYSYFPNTNIYICIRMFIFCKKLIDIFVRPSQNDWCVHGSNQMNELKIINQVNDYFDDYFKKNKTYIQNIIDELYELVGDGLYAHDFIFVNNKLILCELGYKVLAPNIIRFFDVNNFKTNKLICNKFKVKNTYKNLLLNY